MISIKRFIFNNFQVNTYILHNEKGECLIIDPACYSREEEKQITDFIESNHLTLVKTINTHNHIDHILGNPFIKDTYNIPLLAHQSGDIFLKSAFDSAAAFGFILKEVVSPDAFIDEGDVIELGSDLLQVIYTPGHADGSICLYSEADKFVITGDALFKDSIGRTDLPTGDFEVLNKNIKEKLFTLPPDTLVYPGHGPATTIGDELMNNPFVTF